jgi:hypothetical protein
LLKRGSESGSNAQRSERTTLAVPIEISGVDASKPSLNGRRPEDVPHQSCKLVQDSPRFRIDCVIGVIAEIPSEFLATDRDSEHARQAPGAKEQSLQFVPPERTTPQHVAGCDEDRCGDVVSTSSG